MSDKNGKSWLFAKLDQICTAHVAHNTHRLGKGDNLSQRIKINHFRIWLISLFGQENEKIEWVDKNVNPIYHCHWWHAWLCLTSARALRFFETENSEKLKSAVFEVLSDSINYTFECEWREATTCALFYTLSMIFLSQISWMIVQLDNHMYLLWCHRQTDVLFGCFRSLFVLKQKG